MGGPRKITSPKRMEELWEEYKHDCNNQDVVTHDFSSKNSEFVTATLKRSITYTIEGFCVYVKLSRQCFYENYAKNDRFADIVTRMKDECEIDARKKFELQIIPSQLAGLWMSKHGYTTKTEENKKVDMSLMQSLLDVLEGDDSG